MMPKFYGSFACHDLMDITSCNKVPKVAFIGDIRRNGFTTVKYLRRKGIEADLFVYKDSSFNFGDEKETPSWIKIIDIKQNQFIMRKWNIIKYILSLSKKYDIIHARGGVAIYHQLFSVPYVAQTTGSDLRESALNGSFKGNMLMKGYKKANFLFFSQTDHVEIVNKYHLKNACYLPLIVDTENYCPQNTREVWKEHELVIFHPSHLDWTYNYGNRDTRKGNNSPRNSTKGNDRLIKAFSKFVKQGHKGLLIMLERGVDVQETKELVDNLGVKDFVKYLPELSQMELNYHFNSADIIADQFDVGTLGLISYDAMACAKPVMAYLNEKAASSCYPELPPFLNCRTEDDIYNCLIQALDKKRLEHRGRAAREWILKYHHWGYVTDCLMSQYIDIMNQ